MPLRSNAVPSITQRAFYRALGQFCFNRITVHRRPELTADRPVLFVGLHRNGALDGAPYIKAVPDAAFLVSAQLHRSAIGRWLFPGIAVARAKDRRRGIAADNEAGLAACIDHLAAGGRLFVMPEGTSSLGPRHLPFKPGAAQIARAVLGRRPALTVVPVAVYYECAWQWQSRVEVAFGAPLELTAADAGDLAALQQRIALALEGVGINVDTPEQLALIERLAYGATLGSGRAYAACLKQLESGVPAELHAEAEHLDTAARQAGAWTHQGVPLTPIGSALPYWLLWLALAPLLAAFALANLPPLLIGHLAGRKLADDVNVVAFWRAMAGFPSALLWSAALGGALLAMAGPLAAIAYLGLSLLGLKLVYRFRKLSVAVYNSLFARPLKTPLLRLRARLLRALDRKPECEVDHA